MFQSTEWPAMLRCPRCCGAIGYGVARCLGCGTEYARHGSILDFLDEGAGEGQLPMPVEEYARRVIEDPVGFRETLKAKDSSADSLREMAGRTDLGQVLNDTTRILVNQGAVAPSPFFEFVSKHLQLDADSMVLDVGASCGRHLWELKERSPCGMVALDINLIVLTIGSLAWEAAGSPVRPTWVRGDALKLPFHDAAFTHVMSNVTLILVPVQAALRELYRVLQPGGRVFFTVEGPGALEKYWDIARPWSRRRFNLLRQRLGNALLKAGLDWQDQPLLKRLSRQSQFDLGTIERLVACAGFLLSNGAVSIKSTGNSRW